MQPRHVILPLADKDEESDSKFGLSMGKPPTLASMARFPTLRKSSFICQLHDQLQVHQDTEPQRQRQKEVQEIYRILKRPAETRETNEIDTLYEWVLKNGSTNKIFLGAQEIICKTICREMTLLELPTKGVVCYQGDYGDTFFVVISGSVSLFINPNPKPRVILDEESNPTLAGNDEVKLLPEQYGTFIKHITDGGTFGELAVMDPTARRSCTIVCDEPTSFICLKRGSYQRLIRITNSSQLDFTQIEFLETIYFFDGWPHGELTRLSNRLRQVSYSVDSYLTRIGAEANVVFFIYAGLVQETVPMIQQLNENGSVQRCAELESNLAKRAMHGLGGKRYSQQSRRTELELSLYQDHDICGEYPILFNKPSCTTDLLALTDVKALVMDRDTWKDLFYMHALDHIRESFHKLRKLAEARENWRKTRVKLALANPGLILTISTKSMMQDGKCMCSWCGNPDHTTGDPCCPSLAVSRKKQEDKQKKESDKKPKKHVELAVNVQTVNDNSRGASTLDHEGSPSPKKLTKSPAKSPAKSPTKSPTVNLATIPIIQPVPPSPSGHQSHRLRSPSIKVVALNILSNNSAAPAQSDGHASRHRIGSIPEGAESPSNQGGYGLENNATHRKDAISDFPELQKVSNRLYVKYQKSLNSINQDDDHQALPSIKVEDVRKGAFTERVADEYKQEMARRAKRLTSMDQYIGIRTKVLEDITAAHTCGDNHEVRRLPRKPKIPKPSRRLVNPKTKQPRPDRFNRKINRMMRKIWREDHALPVVEESLRDP